MVVWMGGRDEVINIRKTGLRTILCVTESWVFFNQGEVNIKPSVRLKSSKTMSLISDRKDTLNRGIYPIIFLFL